VTSPNLSRSPTPARRRWLRSPLARCSRLARSTRIWRVPLPGVNAIQLLYRTTSELDQPIDTVASMLWPLIPTGTPNLVSYQSAYDSLTPTCEPSYALAGGFDHGLVASGETAESLRSISTSTSTSATTASSSSRTCRAPAFSMPTATAPD